MSFNIIATKYGNWYIRSSKDKDGTYYTWASKSKICKDSPAFEDVKFDVYFQRKSTRELAIKELIDEIKRIKNENI